MASAPDIRTMSSGSVRVEPSESRRLAIATGSDGTRRITFRMGANWFVALFLAFWLCGWAVGEVFALGAVLGNAVGGESLFMIAWLGAWTIGGGFAASYLLWMLFGQEVVEVNIARLLHAYRIFGLHRIRAFETTQISRLRYLEEALSRSTRTSLAFDYGTRTIRIFRAIDSAEANKVVAVLDETLGRRGES